MTKDYGVPAKRRRVFGAVAAILILAGGVGVVVQDWIQHREEGIADYKAWMAAGPRCPPPPKAIFGTPDAQPAQIDNFGGMRFARVHGAILCSDVAYDKGRGNSLFPVCQFDHPGVLEISTRRGLYWFWAGFMSPATISVQHDIPSCVIGATQDFGHRLVFDAPAS